VRGDQYVVKVGVDGRVTGTCWNGLGLKGKKVELNQMVKIVAKSLERG